FLQMSCLRCQLFGRLLQVGRVELRKIARATLCSNCARRRSTFPRVKFLSRVLTALNLLPSIATLDAVSRPICRHNSTNCTQTCLIAGPLSLRVADCDAPVGDGAFRHAAEFLCPGRRGERACQQRTDERSQIWSHVISSLHQQFRAIIAVHRCARRMLSGRPAQKDRRFWESAMPADSIPAAHSALTEMAAHPVSKSSFTDYTIPYPSERDFVSARSRHNSTGARNVRD